MGIEPTQVEKGPTPREQALATDCRDRAGDLRLKIVTDRVRRQALETRTPGAVSSYMFSTMPACRTVWSWPTILSPVQPTPDNPA